MMYIQNLHSDVISQTEKENSLMLDHDILRKLQTNIPML